MRRGVRQPASGNSPSDSFLRAVEESIATNRCRNKCASRSCCVCFLILLIVPLVYMMAYRLLPESLMSADGCSNHYEKQRVYPSHRQHNPRHKEIPIDTVPDASDPDLKPEDILAWARARTKAAEEGHKWLARMPSPEDWASSIIYQIQVDRFNNGDLENDYLNVKADQLEEMLLGNWKLYFRHGGDLKGIRDRLPYLNDLGVNTLWLTPVQANNGDYHGYTTSDPTRIDANFGTNEEYRQLVREAHLLGMRVIMDVVVNHLCDRSTHYENDRPKLDANIAYCAEGLMKQHWQGFGDLQTGLQLELNFSSTFFPPFKRQEFFSRCGTLTIEQMDQAGAPSVFGDFAEGFFDYDTRNPDWQELFTELFKWWIAYADVDGFRCDAAKHVTEDFLAYFSTHIRDYAKTLGKDNFQVIGEVAGPSTWQARRIGSVASDPYDPTRVDVTIGVPKGLTRRLLDIKDVYSNHTKFPLPGLSGGYDFNMAGQFNQYVSGKHLTSCIAEHMRHDLDGVLAQLPGMDCCADAPAGCTPAMGHLWNFVEIHDWPRFHHADPYNMNLGILGFAWIMTAPPQPIVYYGQEMGFTGLCTSDMVINAGLWNEDFRRRCLRVPKMDPGREFSRQDMFQSGPFLLGSSIPEINRLAYAGKWEPMASPPWEQDPMLDRSHALYRTARQLIHLRKACPVLTKGLIEWRYAEPVPCGVMAFSRIMYKPAVEALIIINPTTETRKVSIVRVDEEVNPGTNKAYVNVINGRFGSTIRRDHKTYLFFDPPLILEDYGFAIFMDEALVSQDAEFGIRVCRRPFKHADASSLGNVSRGHVKLV